MCCVFSAQALLTPYTDLEDADVERYFSYACVWAFGGSLTVRSREVFSQWWRETFQDYSDYPEQGTVSGTSMAAHCYIVHTVAPGLKDCPVVFPDRWSLMTVASECQRLVLLYYLDK